MNNNRDIISDAEIIIKRHIGKVGIILSILGGITSILIGGKFILASGIVLSITNIGVFIGSIMYERLSNEFHEIRQCNESLQNEKNEMIKRVSIYQFPKNDTPISTIRSIDTEPYEEVVNINNILKPSAFPNN